MPTRELRRTRAHLARPCRTSATTSRTRQLDALIDEFIQKLTELIAGKDS